MGINDAFSSWLRGAQSFATTTLRTAQAQAAALQAQTMTALTGAQRAVTQPFQQPPTSSSRSSSPYTTQTLNPLAAAAGAVQSGARAVQEGVGQIVQAHAPIVQGIQRDAGRAVQAAPGFVRSAPVAVQQGVQQIIQAHAPIAQGLQRDVGRAVQTAPAIVRSAPATMQQGVQQIIQAHAPIVQSVQRDAGRVAQSVSRGIDFANRQKMTAQAELTRRAGPARSFEQGLTYPVYQAGQEVNRRYQQFIADSEPWRKRTNILQFHPGLYALGEGFSRAPGRFIEDLTWLAPAAERVGQITWKEPHKLPETASRFMGEQYAGLSDSFGRDPWGTVGEVGGSLLIGAAVGGGIGRVRGTTTRPVSGGKGASILGPRGAGHRFRALEFGYRTELVRKPATPQKPFSVAEWHKERQKYARGRAAIQVQETPMRTQAPTQPRAEPGKGGASRQTSPPPESSRSRAVYGVPPLLTGHMPAQVAPAGHVVLPTTMPPGAPQRGGRGPQTDQVVRGARISSTLVTQDLASRGADVLAMITAPPSVLAPPLATSMIIRPGAETKAQTSPPRPRQAPGGPPFTVQPPRAPAKGKDKKKKGEEERRRRKKKGEADHWEYGPAPGLAEMGVMIFGAGRRSVLNLGGSPLSFGFAARAPARPPVIPSFGPPAKTPGKKPARAGENKKKGGRGAKKKK